MASILKLGDHLIKIDYHLINGLDLCLNGGYICLINQSINSNNTFKPITYEKGIAFISLSLLLRKYECSSRFSS
jgi:hypothetical protein